VEDGCQSKLVSIRLLYDCVKVCSSPLRIQYMQHGQESRTGPVYPVCMWFICMHCQILAVLPHLPWTCHFPPAVTSQPLFKAATNYFIVIIVGGETTPRIDSDCFIQLRLVRKSLWSCWGVPAARRTFGLTTFPKQKLWIGFQERPCLQILLHFPSNPSNLVGKVLLCGRSFPKLFQGTIFQERNFKGFFLEKRPWKRFLIKCSNSGINESTPQTQSNVSWISSKATWNFVLENSSMKKASRKWSKNWSSYRREDVSIGPCQRPVQYHDSNVFPTAGTQKKREGGEMNYKKKLTIK